MYLIKKVYLIVLNIIIFIIDLFKNVFVWRRKCLSKRKLDNKVVLITGGNSGIGKETAYQLSLRGAQIIIGCRNITKGNEAINDIKSKNPKANIRVFQLDLGSLLSVRKFAQTVAQHESTIDILINNAGVVSYVELQTEDGFELQFGTNHLGHFLLTHLLLPLLKNSQKAKVINVSSKAHKTGKIHFENINLRNGIFTPLKAYSQSKLANVLFTREMTRRLGPKSSITTYCLHPGIVRTDLNRHFPLQFAINIFINMFYLDIESGVQTTLYCALDPSLDNESAFYYDDCQRVDRMTRISTDENIAKKLWELSCDLVKLEPNLTI